MHICIVFLPWFVEIYFCLHWQTFFQEDEKILQLDCVDKGRNRKSDFFPFCTILRIKYREIISNAVNHIIFKK